ncbi:MAG TPA: HEAT repeat domain-containing protein [Verrucomicrobiae bacterium]
MVEKRRILFGLFVTGLLVAFAWLVLRPHEPSFEGRSLSLWLEQAFPRGLYELRLPPVEATRAVSAIGTNALPILIRLVAARESTGRRVLGHLAREFPILHLPPQEGNGERAVWAFTVLGPAARPAAPALVRLLNDKDVAVRVNAARCLGELGPAALEAVPALVAVLNRKVGSAWQDVVSRDAAAGALGQIGAAAVPAIPHLAALTNVPAAEMALLKIRGDSFRPFIGKLKDTSDAKKWVQAARLVADLGTNAEPAIPFLLSALNSTNRTVQEQGFYAITRIHRQPETCIPAMITLLGSPDPNVRYRALLALGAFRGEATSAVPAIIHCFESSRSWMWVQFEATNALREIDPEAAAKIQLKPGR